VSRPRRRAWPTLLAAAGALAAQLAHACGVCIDDKVAAAYDHAVVTGAAGRGHVVVFAEVHGPRAASDRMGAARAAARRVPGIAAESVRTSQELAALSFALDPRVRSPQAALAAVEAAARPPGALRLELLKVLR
jgi:hypothetical protein